MTTRPIPGVPVTRQPAPESRDQFSVPPRKKEGGRSDAGDRHGCPTLSERMSAALYVAVCGVEGAGIVTREKLMYPHTTYGDDDVRRAAARLLASAQVALLEALPPARTERIEKDLGAYLSFALGDGWPDENTPCLEAG